MCATAARCAHALARKTRWRLAVDVDNPLVGELGAAAVFGPQKWATPADVVTLDAGLAHLAVRLARRPEPMRPPCSTEPVWVPQAAFPRLVGRPGR